MSSSKASLFRALPLLLAASSIILPGTVCSSDGSAGGVAGESLFLMSSARSEGLMAPVSGGGGLNGVSANPASLSGQAARMVSGSYTDLLGGASVGQLEAAFPAGAVVLAGQLGNFQAGEVDLPDSSGNSRKVQIQNDIVAGVSVAMPVWGGLSAGISMKWFQSTLVETYKASTQLIDAGLRYALLDGELSLGAAVRNLGGRLNYYSSGMPLPVSQSAGASLGVWHSPDINVLVLGEAERREGLDIRYSAGAEAVFQGVLILRGGAMVDDGIAASSVGAGICFRSYGFDFARVARPGMPVSSRVSASMEF